MWFPGVYNLVSVVLCVVTELRSSIAPYGVFRVLFAPPCSKPLEGSDHSLSFKHRIRVGELFVAQHVSRSPSFAEVGGRCAVWHEKHQPCMCRRVSPPNRRLRLGHVCHRWPRACTQVAQGCFLGLSFEVVDASKHKEGGPFAMGCGFRPCPSLPANPSLVQSSSRLDCSSRRPNVEKCEKNS